MHFVERDACDSFLGHIISDETISHFENFFKKNCREKGWEKKKLMREPLYFKNQSHIKCEKEDI